MTSLDAAEDRPAAASPSVSAVVEAAGKELLRLMRERDQVISRIQMVKKVITGLAELYGEQILDDDLALIVGAKIPSRKQGITDACRSALLHALKPLGVREVCEIIQETNPKLLEAHKSPIATLTTILTRLAAYGEIRALTDEGHKKWESNT